MCDNRGAPDKAALAGFATTRERPPRAAAAPCAQVLVPRRSSLLAIYSLFLHPPQRRARASLRSRAPTLTVRTRNAWQSIGAMVPLPVATPPISTIATG